MTVPYPHPGFGPPPARPLMSWLPGVLLGVIALVGLGATLLPVWVVHVGDDYLRGPGVEAEGFGGSVDVAFNFYSWVASAVPVFGLIPLALAAAVAAAATQLVRGADRGLWGATAALMTVTVLLAGSVALRPAPVTAVTGELAEQMSPDDLQRFGSGPADLPVSYGAGLIIALGCVLAVLAVAAWQYRAAAPRRTPVMWGPSTIWP